MIQRYAGLLLVCLCLFVFTYPDRASGNTCEDHYFFPENQATHVVLINDRADFSKAVKKVEKTGAKILKKKKKYNMIYVIAYGSQIEAIQSLVSLVDSIEKLGTQSGNR